MLFQSGGKECTQTQPSIQWPGPGKVSCHTPASLQLSRVRGQPHFLDTTCYFLQPSWILVRFWWLLNELPQAYWLERTLILLQFWRPEAQDGPHWAKIKVLLGSPPVFKASEVPLTPATPASLFPRLRPCEHTGPTWMSSNPNFITPARPLPRK